MKHNRIHQRILALLLNIGCPFFDFIKAPCSILIMGF